MATTTTKEPTDKMYRYLQDLVRQRGENMHDFLIGRGITKLEGWPTAQTVARKPTYSECHTLLDELAPPRRTAARRGHGRGRYSTFTYRCTHEDYPCCGCGPDAGR